MISTVEPKGIRKFIKDAKELAHDVYTFIEGGAPLEPTIQPQVPIEKNEPPFDSWGKPARFVIDFDKGTITVNDHLAKQPISGEIRFPYEDES